MRGGSSQWKRSSESLALLMPGITGAVSFSFMMKRGPPLQSFNLKWGPKLQWLGQTLKFGSYTDP